MGVNDPDFDIETTIDLDNIDEEAAQKLLKKADLDLEVVEKEDERIRPEDVNKKPLPENVDAEPTEEELKAYSDQVRQRIEKLTHARHDERRYKEQAERERDEAVAFAQRIFNEKKALEEQAKKLAEGSMTATAAKIDADLAAAKRAYIDAVNAYDAEAMYEAQESVARLTARKEALESQKTTALAVDKPPTTEVQPRQSINPAPDTRARDWAARNSSWFQKDKAMTAFVFGVHEQLVEEGVDPRIDPETYYKRLDESVKKRFPERFEPEAPATRTPRTSSPVAPATRVASGRRRVALTAAEMSLARRLGVTPEQFAAEKIKLENSNV
jgi:hypothetical protein